VRDVEHLAGRSHHDRLIVFHIHLFLQSLTPVPPLSSMSLERCASRKTTTKRSTLARLLSPPPISPSVSSSTISAGNILPTQRWGQQVRFAYLRLDQITPRHRPKEQEPQLTLVAVSPTGTVIKKVAYGVALPGLFVSVTIYTHVGAKMIFVRLLRYVPAIDRAFCANQRKLTPRVLPAIARGSDHLTSHSFTHWAVWLGCVAGCVTLSFILAEGE
jgi:hypothetical protein